MSQSGICYTPRGICYTPNDLISQSTLWDRTVTQQGNRIVALVNGEQAYPAMMDAIADARKSIFLSMYQFDDDNVGSRFAELFADARAAGIDVRVILDAWGDLKSNPSIRSRLLRSRVEVRSFHSIRRLPKYNQRYHRKLLLVDGAVGFTGGMNVRDRHLVDSYTGNPMRDTVFRIEGPVLGMLEALFVKDWRYCGGRGDYEPPAAHIGDGTEKVTVLGAGPPFCRTALLETLTRGIATASRRVIAITPFFFPDAKLLLSFIKAAEKGTTVEIILPTGDYEFLRWCASTHLARLHQSGCTVYLSPPPYDHSKILVIDDMVMIGTVNLDCRSIHYNWEVAMTCRGGSLLSEVLRLIEEQKRTGTRLETADLRDTFVKTLAGRVIIGAIGKLL